MGIFSKMLETIFEPEEGAQIETSKKSERGTSVNSEGLEMTRDIDKEGPITDDIVRVAYDRFDKLPDTLFKVEEIVETLKGEEDETTRNALVRKLLKQFGNNLEDLRAEATCRMDEIKKVQADHEARYQEKSMNIESMIASTRKALEDFTAESNKRIDELKAEEENNATKLASDKAGAKKEMERLEKILFILMETEA